MSAAVERDGPTHQASGLQYFRAALEQGLRSEHVCIDYGCGSLRVGSSLIDYLDPGKYWGLDSVSEFYEDGKALLRAGIALPPLRERRGDIRYLVAHFLRKFGESRRGGTPEITEGALHLLEDQEWPGNVRELENAIERAVVLCDGGVIDCALVAPEERRRDRTDGAIVPRLTDALDRVEKETIQQALDQAGDVKLSAARILGVSPRTLWYKLRKHGIG